MYKAFEFFCIFTIFIIVNSVIAKGKQASSCCQRVPHVYNIGYDISGRPIQLDVGRCSASCGSIDAFRSNHYVSVLERIQGKKVQSNTATCDLGNHGGHATCEPSLVHVETVAFNRGPKFYDVIDECVCRKVPKRCQRVQKMKRFFVGTEYEATVDIGDCVGGCRNDKNGKVCRSTRTTSQPIRGPNGILSVESISECRCETTCYRQNFNVAVTESHENSNGNIKLRTKVIDVGRCVGTCGPIGRCVVRANKRGDTKCLMSLETHDVTCAPTRVHDVTYTNRHGEKERVAQIRRCGCT